MALMFDKSKVEEFSHPLVRLLRLIFYKKKVTLDDFSSKYAQHGKILGLHPSITNTNRNNARKALQLETMTWDFFSKTLHNILRLNIVDFSVTVQDTDTGKLTTYKFTDKVE